tara:strand:- start:199 stop:375 length:177 start_codon:yes stop_codon:yes gene_type:complete
MGFNKIHLPPIEKLQWMVLTKGVTYVLNRYNGPKVDALIGDIDAMEYLDKLAESNDVE